MNHISKFQVETSGSTVLQTMLTAAMHQKLWLLKLWGICTLRGPGFPMMLPESCAKCLWTLRMTLKLEQVSQMWSSCRVIHCLDTFSLQFPNCMATSRHHHHILRYQAANSCCTENKVAPIFNFTYSSLPPPFTNYPLESCQKAIHSIPCW